MASGTAFASGTAYGNGTYGGGFWNRYTGGSAFNTAGSTAAAAKASTGSVSDAAKEDTKEVIDWVEIMIDRIERKIDELDTKASSVYRDWSERNKNLADEISKVTEEITLQESAYNTYMKKANSVGLSEEYKKKVRDGKLQIEDITDEKLKEKIDEYQEYYEKALDCQEAQTELNEKVQDLLQQDFDNIIKQYDQLTAAIERVTDSYSAQLTVIENKGNFAGKAYYEEIMKSQQENLKTLEKQIKTAQDDRWNKIKSGKIKYGTEQDAENLAQIEELQAKWTELYADIISTKNDMWEMDWSIFDKTIDYISEITKETEFLRDALSLNEVDLFDKLSGELSDIGNSVGALHAIDYATYMDEADKYAAKVLEINKMIAQDPTNTILIDKRNEYLQAQRDSIKAANEEKKAVKDLYSDAYSKMLDVLQDLIDKRKKELDAQKSAYDYQRDIAKQTKEITNLQKQLMALEGDTSEDAKSKTQQLKVSLEEAQEDLRDTEYDKWKTDQEELLDGLYEEYEKILNERLDNIDYLMQQMIDYGNANAAMIKSTINQAAASVGYAITGDLNSVLSANAGDGMTNFYGDGKDNTTVTNYTNKTTNTVNNSVNNSGKVDTVDINEEGRYAEWQAELEAKRKAEEEAKKQQQQQQQTTTSKASLTADTIKGIASAIWCEAGSGWGNYPQRKTRLEQKFGAGAYDKVQSYINSNLGSLYSYWANNLKGNAKKYWYSSFDTGGYTGNDEGFAMLHSKERILNAQQTKAFENLIYEQLPDISKWVNAFDIPNVKGFEQNVSADVNVSFTLPNVTNATEFMKELQTSKKFEKLVQSMTVDQLAGRSTLSKNRIKI